VSFEVSGETYDRFVGRYSVRLAPLLLDFGGVAPPARALDVGCGPGPLTVELATRLGAAAVAAADPSESFVAACAARVPGADVRLAAAEALPWDDGSFDVVLSQLVVNFMRDPAAGLVEMCRVVRPGGRVASCTWEYRAGMRMLRVFFDAALALDPSAPDEGRVMRFQDGEDLARLWSDTGLRAVETAPLDVAVEYADFDDYWLPFESGVGPAGAYCASLAPRQREALREECRRRLGSPSSPFTLSARAWAVRGSTPA
jgi:SAM-dependent methyltransferase